MAQTGLTVDFKTMTNGDFEIKCNLIVTSMTGNKNFPKPTPSVKELDATAKKFSDASALAADGGSMQRRQRDAQREIVTALLVELKAYMEYESKGDKIKLASSGFTLRGQKARHSANNEVKKFVIKHGKISGTSRAVSPILPGPPVTGMSTRERPSTMPTGRPFPVATAGLK